MGYTVYISILAMWYVRLGKLALGDELSNDKYPINIQPHARSTPGTKMSGYRSAQLSAYRLDILGSTSMYSSLVVGLSLNLPIFLVSYIVNILRLCSVGYVHSG